MANIKPPAVAGTFYPSDPAELRAMISTSLSKAKDTPLVPKAIIAPHAGLRFSGDIAANAYHVLRHVKDKIKRVVLLGPSHHVAFMGVAVPSFDAFATPLGNVPIDKEFVAKAAGLVQVQVFDQAFAQEHSLEVQLPFLQAILDEFTIVPLLVSYTQPVDVAAVLSQLWGGPETLVVISSDLSHYHDYITASRMDLATTLAIQSLKIEHVGDHQACGRYPMKGLMYLAKELGLNVRPLDIRNSGDTFGNKDRVVGYGAYHFYHSNEKIGLYTPLQKQLLLQLARRSIKQGLKNGELLKINEEDFPFDPGLPKATFVTIEKDNQLRGCIGTLQASLSITEDVANNAYKAAFKDHRFKPLTLDEYEQSSLHISVLSPLTEIEFDSEADLLQKIRPGIDGLILKDNHNVGTFLPMVWRSHHDTQSFFRHLKNKAKLPEDHWSESLKVYQFTTDLIGP